MSEEIEEHINEMKMSFKRSEHSLYVSLKYTRTVDVIKNLIERYVNTLIHGIDALVQKLFEENKISEIPETPIEKINLIRATYSDNEELISFLDWLIFLRKLLRSKYGKCEEFRKNVTMCAIVDGEEHGIKIETLTDYLEKMKNYILLIGILSGTEDENKF